MNAQPWRQLPYNVARGGQVEEKNVAGPFRRGSPKSGFGRALRSKRAATFEAIENLLAVSDSVREVGPGAVAQVGDAHGVDLSRRFASDRRHLYRRYLAYCLEDKVLSEEENADLQHLRTLLHLEEGDVAAVHDEVAREVYGKAIQEVLADLEIDAEEEAFLRRLRGELHLSEKVAADLLERGRYDAHDIALSQAASLDDDFSVYRAPSGEFTGRSEATFEEAIADALSKAQIAIPNLHWFEVVHIAGYVGEGKPSGWHVTVRCGLSPDDANV
jgi:flavin-binding protein dodecin